MNPEVNTENIGEQLGTEGVGSIVTNAEAYCACEERRIALVNEPRIVALRAEGQALVQEENGITERLKHEPPPGDLRSRRRRAAYFWAVTVILAVAGFVFSLYALEPFRLGLKSYLYSLGIAIAVPFLVDFTIMRWKLEALIKCLSTGAFCAGLLSLVLLAAIRGDLMVESLKNSDPVITFDDAPPQAAPPRTTFYDRTIPRLQLVMILLAVSMELAAGLAMHEAWRLSSDVKEDWGKLGKRLKEIQEQKGALIFEIVALENAPQVFHETFWRSFYRAILAQTVRGMIAKGLAVVLGIFLIAHDTAAAQNHTAIVIAVDLSRSVDVRGPDGKTEFQKNIEAVAKQLAQIPADSRLTVIGITDRSFTQPLILLSAAIPADTGYFDERLKAGRAELVRTWKLRSSKLTPSYLQTDIIGALELSEQIFSVSVNSEHKVLIIYSDMRQSTPALNLEALQSQHLSAFTTRKGEMPDLRGVQVEIVGVDGAGRSIGYWQTLRRFWVDYISKAGATLRDYSVLRDSTNLR